MTGLTLNGNTLNILDTSLFDLQFDANVNPGLDWAFRWLNPVVGDRTAAINAWIGSGRITFSAPSAVSVFDNGDGYTYVGYATAIPEPAAGLLSVVVFVLGLFRRRRKMPTPA